jgi:hypothetical protein
MASREKVLTTDQLVALQKKWTKCTLTRVDGIRRQNGERHAQTKDVGLKELERFIMFGASPRASINLILTAARSPSCADATMSSRKMCWTWRWMSSVIACVSYEALSENVQR